MGRLQLLSSWEEEGTSSFRRPPNTLAIQMHHGISCKQDHKKLSYSALGFLGSVTKAAGRVMETERLLSRTFTDIFLQHRRQMHPPNITDILQGSAIPWGGVRGVHPSEKTTGQKQMRARFCCWFCYCWVLLTLFNTGKDNLIWN